MPGRLAGRIGLGDDEGGLEFAAGGGEAGEDEGAQGLVEFGVGGDEAEDVRGGGHGAAHDRDAVFDKPCHEGVRRVGA